MNSLRIPLIVLAVVQALLAAAGLVASTAFDGGLWGRIPMVLFHPPAAIALLWLLLTDRPTPRLAGVTLALLLLSIISDLALSGAILSGLTKGDWWLALVFVIIPLLSLPYVINALGSRQETPPRFAG